MMSNKFHLLAFVLVLTFFSGGCASPTGIFPSVPVSTSESSADLPNPISLIFDSTNSQMLVANSNVDILYSAGSIAVMSVNASDTNAPQLALATLIETPNFAGEMFLDGVGNLYVPFRETSSLDKSFDTLMKYSVSASSISIADEGVVDANPFGITGTATTVYVVSDNILSAFDSSLTLQDAVDLTTAHDAEISNSLANDVLSVALDASANMAVVSNVNGRLFLVDLSGGVLSQAVDGPLSTRNVIINGDRLYALDYLSESVWVFDFDLLAAAVSAPEAVDDSQFLVDVISVGNAPFGMAIDTTMNRLYVANSLDDTVSVIDLDTHTEIARISLDQEDISSSFLRDGDEPVALSVGTFNAVNYIFVACFKSNSIVMIHPVTLNVVEVFPDTAM